VDGVLGHVCGAPIVVQFLFSGLMIVLILKRNFATSLLIGVADLTGIGE